MSPLRTKQGTNTAIILYAQSTSILEFTIVYITNKEDSPNPPKKHFKTRSQDFLSLIIKTANAHRKRENIINILKWLIKDKLLLLFCVCLLVHCIVKSHMYIPVLILYIHVHTYILVCLFLSRIALFCIKFFLSASEVERKLV